MTMDRLVGLVLIAAALFGLVWLYDAFPDQRAILIFGSIIGSTIATRCTCEKGEEQ